MSFFAFLRRYRCAGIGAAFSFASFCTFPLAAADVSAPGLLGSLPGAIGGASFIVPSFLFSTDPRAAAYNPASFADRELPAFGASAALAFPTGVGTGSGGAFSVFASFPTMLGSAYAIADGVFAQSTLTGYSAPLGASLLAGLSKSATDTLSFGASLGMAAQTADSSATGVFGAVGAQLLIPNLAAGGTFFSAALLGLGSRPAPWNAYRPTIAWTPLVSASARLVDGKTFSLTASALIASPEAADLLFSAGVSFGLGSIVALDLGWLFSLSETFRYASGVDAALSAPRFFPSLAVRLDGSSFLRVSSYGASLGASVRPVSGGASIAESSVVFSRGTRDIEGPQIALGPISEKFVSPLRTGTLSLPLSIRDPSGISAWEAVLYDESGSAVFRQGDNAGLKDASDAFARFFSLKKKLQTPNSVSVPLSSAMKDGSYQVRVWARDLRGNEGRSSEFRLLIDGEAPQAKVAFSSAAFKDPRGAALFTPNEDGFFDTLTISQSGSVESSWQGRFLDSSGNVVRSYRWVDGAPLDFAWDGKNQEGAVVPDGDYSYVLDSTDGAGNRASFTLEKITVDTDPTLLSLSLDSNVLSPDQDGAFESVKLFIQTSAGRAPLDWSIELISEKGIPFRAWQGTSARLSLLPATLVFDGRNTDGDPIPDGAYRFRAKLRYANGNTPSAVSDTLVVDTKKPEGRVRSSTQVLSVGSGAAMTFYHDLSRNAQWRGVIFDDGGTPVQSFSIAKPGESSIEWNGLADKGDPLPDGVYRYAAEGKSSSGIFGKTAAVSFRIESGNVAAALFSDTRIFSPTLARSTVRLMPRLAKRERVVSYELRIEPVSGGAPVRRFSGVSLPPSSLVWDGLDEANRLCPDGSYRALFSVKYENAQEAEAEPIQIVLDGTPPAAKLTLADTLFSPNGDGKKDTIQIGQTIVSPGDSWTAEILDSKGRAILVREYTSAVPAPFVWDGKTEQGDIAPYGSYRYRLSAFDAAGNEGLVETASFKLDARTPSVVLSSDKVAFSPNADGFADTIRLRAVPSFTDGLLSAAVRIVDEAGVAVFRYPAGGLKSEYVWDGKKNDGRLSPDGNYKAVIELSYEKGDVVSSESASVLLDAAPPLLSADLSPLPFSPDGDGENDTLSIRLYASDKSLLAGWSFAVLDPEGYPFASFSGRNLPSDPLVWDGTDPDGNLVEAAQDYPYVYTVRDQLGNVARAEGKIPVDVFVLRDGDRLKIRVSSITFAPNAAALQVDDPVLSEKNRMVLDRIAAVLAKFPNYRIRVEGHAVNLSGTEREERTELEPLSLARAQTVVASLIQRGIASTRLEARGLGGREPVVPHGDEQFRWRNRRVEFILVR